MKDTWQCAILSASFFASGNLYITLAGQGEYNVGFSTPWGVYGMRVILLLMVYMTANMFSFLLWEMVLVHKERRYMLGDGGNPVSFI